MGLLSHFFSYLAADAVRDAKKEQEKNEKWNRSFSVLQKREIELQNYLNSVGCNLLFIFDANVIDNGDIASEVKKMEKVKKDVEEYLALGGDIQILFGFDQLERHIEVLRYLRKIGQVHRQHEFLDDNKYSVEEKIKAEEEALAQQIAWFKAEQQVNRETMVANMIGSDINSMSGIDFEVVCQQLVESMGFRAEITKASGDGGIDLIAHNYQPLLSGKYIIQCKRYSGSVGEPIIRDLYGVVMSERANKGILMTTGQFTRSAIAFAEGKPMELIDGVKLKELLLQYGLCYEDNSSDSCDNSLVSIEFDPSPFMGYYYDNYLDAKSCVERDPCDIRSRCKLIEIIQQTINMRLYLFDLGDNGTYNINHYDIQGMANLLRDNLQSILQFDNSHSPNKRLKTIYYISMLIDGEVAILSGDLVSATERYGKVLRDWTELRDEKLIFNHILYSLFGVFRLAGCQEMIDKYSSKYKNHIDDCRKFYQKTDSAFAQTKFDIVQLEVINNPYDVTQFIVMSIDDFYDKCVDDWGGINISNGFCRIDRNKDRNNLFYCGQDKWEDRSQETVLLENFDSLTLRQKDLVAHIAQMYL